MKTKKTNKARSESISERMSKANQITLDKFERKQADKIRKSNEKAEDDFFYSGSDREEQESNYQKGLGV